jgi:hypothetical protein
VGGRDPPPHQRVAMEGEGYSGWMRGDVENVMLDVLIGAGARGSSCVFLTDSHFEGGASRICRRLFALLSLFGALCVCCVCTAVYKYI